MITQEGARLESFEEESASVRISIQETNGAVAVPVHEGVPLTQRLLIVEAVDLQDDLRPVGTLRGRDEADASSLKRRSEGEVPSKDQLLDNPGKRLEPGASAAPTRAKLHLYDFTGYRELIHR